MRRNQLLSAEWTQMARHNEEEVWKKYCCVAMETTSLSLSLSFSLLVSAMLHIVRASASPDNGNFAVSVSKSLHPFMLSALSDRKPAKDVSCITSRLLQCDSHITYSYATANFESQFNIKRTKWNRPD